MGLFDRIFKRPPKTARFQRTLSGYPPVFSQWGTDVYGFDAVQQALSCIVTEFKKLQPTHIRMQGDDPVPVKSNVQDVLNDPNPLMTTADFLEKTAWLLLLNENAFIVPVYKEWEQNGVVYRNFEALYPILPTQVDFIEDASGTMFVTFWFLNGYTTTIPYDRVIHVRENYSVNMFMGGNEMGQPNQEALLQLLNLNRQLIQGLAKAMNASYAINGVIKYNSLLDGDKMDAAVAELEEKLANSKDGFLPIDLKGEFIPFERKGSMVDADTLKFLDEKILRTWGISLPILTGDFTKDQYAAFYQHALEHRAITMSQALTKKLFTPRERAFGNRIELYPEALVFLTTQQTLDMINTLSPTGALFENEKRVALGLRPLPELAGKRYMSLNWIDAANADQYQVGKNVNVDVVDEEKEDI